MARRPSSLSSSGGDEAFGVPVGAELLDGVLDVPALRIFVAPLDGLGLLRGKDQGEGQKTRFMAKSPYG